MNHLSALLALTLRDPRAAARYLMALNLPAGAVWSALVLMAVASALLLHIDLTFGADTMPAEPLLQWVYATPFVTAMVQLGMLCFFVIAAHGVGRLFGGQGGLEQVALVVVWVQFVLLLLQMALVVAFLVLPPLAGVIMLALVVLSFWLVSHVLAEVHGFRNAGLVFVGILVSTFVAAFLLALLMVTFLPQEAFHV